jgi:hypothetical protein
MRKKAHPEDPPGASDPPPTSGSDDSSSDVIGTWVHAGLESALTGRPFAADIIWEKLVRARAEKHDAPKYRPDQSSGKSSREGSGERARAEDLLRNTLQSETWTNLVTQWTCRAEAPLVHVVSTRLVQERIDLLCEKIVDGTRHLMVVDFKTTPLPRGENGTLPSLEHLRDFAAARGHSTQVQRYVKTLKKIAPDAEVHAAVFYLDPVCTVML